MRSTCEVGVEMTSLPALIGVVVVEQAARQPPAAVLCRLPGEFAAGPQLVEHAAKHCCHGAVVMPA